MRRSARSSSALVSLSRRRCARVARLCAAVWSDPNIYIYSSVLVSVHFFFCLSLLFIFNIYLINMADYKDSFQYGSTGGFSPMLLFNGEVSAFPEWKWRMDILINASYGALW